ncbi:MAG: flagellar basal body rod protein FlgB [Planctomycetota bacterium]|jgi:flagellar basal-body rod protein FlgB|nr:flagellar basal body rod protein FlgB [Planctomycetota bacterium]
MLSDQRMMNLGKLLDVASLRARVHTANIANQNTPNFRARAVAFDEAFQQALLQSGDEAARAVQPQVFEPHTTTMDNDGNDVSVDREVSELAKNQTLYNTYVSLLRGKHRMYESAIREG